MRLFQKHRLRALLGVILLIGCAEPSAAGRTIVNHRVATAHALRSIETEASTSCQAKNILKFWIGITCKCLGDGVSVAPMPNLPGSSPRDSEATITFLKIGAKTAGSHLTKENSQSQSMQLDRFIEIRGGSDELCNSVPLEDGYEASITSVENPDVWPKNKPRLDRLKTGCVEIG